MLLLDNSVRDSLEQCKDVISETAVTCIDTVLQIPCQVHESWNVTQRLTGEFDHNIAIGNGNDTYQAIMAIGVTDHDLQTFFAYDSIDDIVDVLGELANTYCGMLMDNPDFTNVFGVLTQAIPQYTATCVYYPRAWNYSGYLVNPAGKQMYIGYAIRKLQMAI